MQPHRFSISFSSSTKEINKLQLQHNWADPKNIIKVKLAISWI